MRREWELEDLIDGWTLDGEDAKLLANRSGATRLAFALALKFFELEARFPRHAGELPPAAVKFVAGQLKVDPVLFAAYAWSGRTAEYHRAQIRAALGFREPLGDDRPVIEAGHGGQDPVHRGRREQPARPVLPVGTTARPSRCAGRWLGTRRRNASRASTCGALKSCQSRPLRSRKVNRYFRSYP